MMNKLLLWYRRSLNLQVVLWSKSENGQLLLELTKAALHVHTNHHMRTPAKCD